MAAFLFMKIAFPNNIYAKALAASLPENISSQIYYRESALLGAELDSGNADIALLPSCDLLKREALFVSQKAALSFDGDLANSYFYFSGSNLSEISLRGDISSNDVILSKILFKEKYETSPQFIIDTHKDIDPAKNYLIAGDENFKESKFEKGLSFADELSVLLFLPYVSNVFASKSAEVIQEFNSYMEKIDEKIEDNLEAYLTGMHLEAPVKEFFMNNFNNVYFEMTDNEKEGLLELLKMPYYHGIIEELHDIKFI